MKARLATSVTVSALMRQAESIGGFAAVLNKGDPTAGSIIVILNEKGRKARVFERLLQRNGTYSWADAGGQAIDNMQEFERFLTRRRSFDPDLWLIELDVPSAERFAAEMNGDD